MTKEDFFKIIDLPATITGTYFIINHNIWFFENSKISNIKNEEFSLSGGDYVFEKYFWSMNEIDLIKEMLKSMKGLITYTNHKITDLIEMLQEEYEENIQALIENDEHPPEMDENRG